MTEEVKELACIFAMVSSHFSKEFEDAHPINLLKALRAYKDNEGDIKTALWIENNSVEYVLGGGYAQELHECLSCEAVPERIKEDLREQLKEWQAKQGTVIPKDPKTLRLGSIYLAIANGNGYTKIGFSSVPKARESTLQAEDPSFRLVFASAPKYTTSDERRLHTKYAAKRKRGEWFLLTKTDINAIKKDLA